MSTSESLKIYTLEKLPKVLSRYAFTLVLADRFFSPLQKTFLWKGDLASKAHVIYLDAGENLKSPQSFYQLLSQVSTLLTSSNVPSHSPRDIAILAIGGGTVSDVATLLASLLYRGVDHYIVPTTLLAMVDASIGGKSALNGSSASKEVPIVKNLFGTIHHPKALFYDCMFLRSLPQEQFLSGMAEWYKHALLESNELFEEAIRWIDSFSVKELIEKFSGELFPYVASSAQFKHSLVQTAKKSSLRDFLNLGHTIGHALESLFPLKHGEAIAHGVAIEALIIASVREGSPCDVDTQGLFPWLPSWFMMLRKLYPKPLQKPSQKPLQKPFQENFHTDNIGADLFCKASRNKWSILLGRDKKNRGETVCLPFRGKSRIDLDKVEVSGCDQWLCAINKEELLDVLEHVLHQYCEYL